MAGVEVKLDKFEKRKHLTILNILKIFVTSKNFITTQNIGIGYLLVRSENILQIMILMAGVEAKMDKIGVGIFWKI